MATNFTKFIGNDPVGNLNLQALMAALNNTVPPSQVLQPVNPADYLDQAQREVSPYIDKNLELALKTIDTAKKQAEQTKQLQEQQQAQSNQNYLGIQDVGFSRALQSAQNGYAGRGTSTSGFQNKGISNFFQDKNQTLTTNDINQGQQTDTRNLNFTQFLENNAQQTEQAKLENERQKQQEILSRQQQIANQVSAQNSSIIDNSNRDFNRVLSFANFIKSKAAA